MDKENIQLYDRLEHDEREVKAIVETAYNNGIREGFEQGIKQGIEHGIQLTTQLGIKLGKELRQSINIRNLSEYGMSDAQIANALKIDLDTVKKCLDKLT